MNFERSRQGQENRASFYGVDYVCYVEGGGGASDDSDDVVFWSIVFSTLRPDLKVHFLARGGKPELEARARDVIEKDLNAVLVAMDSDYDELLGEKILDRRVLYTFGYSWENDLFSADVIREILSFKCRPRPLPQDDLLFFENHFDILVRQLKWPVRADYYALVSRSSVLPRNSPGRIFARCEQTNMPIVKLEEVRKLCKLANTRTRTRVLPNLPRIDNVMRFCVGKIYSHVMHLFVCAFIRVRNVSTTRTLTPGHFYDLAQLLFPNILRLGNGRALIEHYSNSLRQI